MRVAIAIPKVPPFSSPKFHPKYIPDITYPTPRPHRSSGESVFLRCVFIKIAVKIDSKKMFKSKYFYKCNLYILYLINL
jgi:hypothetical protein